MKKCYKLTHYTHLREEFELRGKEDRVSANPDRCSDIQNAQQLYSWEQLLPCACVLHIFDSNVVVWLTMLTKNVNNEMGSAEVLIRVKMGL